MIHALGTTAVSRIASVVMVVVLFGVHTRFSDVEHNYLYAVCVDERDIDPCLGQGPGRTSAQIILCTAQDSSHLPTRQSVRRLRVRAAFLDLDEDDRATLGQDQIDLTTPPAPPAFAQFRPATAIMPLNRLFGAQPGMVIAALDIPVPARIDLKIKWHSSPFPEQRP